MDRAALYQLLQKFKNHIPEPVKCNIKGMIPSWLSGSLYRNGSGLFNIGNDQFNHLFDGMAVIHKFTMQEGRVSYQNRLLESQALAKNLQANRIVISEFGTACYPDPCKNIFHRYFSHFFHFRKTTDNDVVNLMTVGDALYALTESDKITRIDPETLKTIDRETYTKYTTAYGATAHPHTEKDGTIYNLGTSISGRSIFYNIIRIPPPTPGLASPVENMSVICNIPCRWSVNHGYSHSFAMTENYIIYIEQPLAVLFHIVEKKTGKLWEKQYSADAMFVFHQVNAYEDDGHIVLDLCAFENADIIESLYLKNMSGPGDLPMPVLTRYVLPLNDTKVTLAYTTASATATPGGSTIHMHPESFEAASYELPQINYGQYNTKKYRYAYGVQITKHANNKILKSDWETRSVLTYTAGSDIILGEPIFIPSPGSKMEDDGVLLVPGSSYKGDQPSGLYLLDARTLQELGRAEIPTDIDVPFTFHGLFLPK